QRAAAAVFDNIPDGASAGRLANDTPVDLLVALAEMLYNFDGAVNGRAFFIAGDQKADGAPMPRMGLDEPLAGGDKGRQAAFHIGGTPAQQHAVFHAGLKGGMLPVLLRPGGDHVGMTGKRQERT